MNIKINYLVIPAVGVLVLWLGKIFTSSGMVWYHTLIKSSITPPGWVFAVAWNVIYVCTVISVLLIWNNMFRDRVFWTVITLFCVNSITNVLWTYLFFYGHFMGYALIDAVVLLVITWCLIVVLWSKNERRAALLLVPYGVWLILAVYLNAAFFLLNS